MRRAVDTDLIDKARVAEASGMFATARRLYLRAHDKASAARCAARLKPEPKRSR